VNNILIELYSSIEALIRYKHSRPDMFILTSPLPSVPAQTVDFVSNISLDGWEMNEIDVAETAYGEALGAGTWWLVDDKNPGMPGWLKWEGKGWCAYGSVVAQKDELGA